MPQRKSRAKAATPIEALTHDDKRVNIPTADAQDFVDDSIKARRVLRYPRDPQLDPQLVWQGKDEQDTEDLLVEAPPLYIQEKVAPRIIVESLRSVQSERDPEPELTLFEEFDGPKDWESVEFYRHAANWSNRLILGDSLQVMGSLVEREGLRGQVQAVYFDPPYGIKFGSNWQVTTKKRDVQDGKLADATREVEQIKAFRDTWELGVSSYLSYLRDRLIVARDLLTQSGSCFVQIGDENVHLVRSVLDEVFGSTNFVAQITFKKTASQTAAALAGTTDYILWYAKSQENLKYRPLLLTKEIGGAGADAYDQVELTDGTRRRLTPDERQGIVPLPEGGRVFRYQILTSARVRESRSGFYPVELEGRTFVPLSREWSTHPEGMQRLISANRVAVTGNSLSYVRYLDDFPGIPLSNFWPDTQSGSGMDKVYVVQTNTRVVERCLLMATDPGDLVLDPTCGSGTTAFVAEQWGRRWITTDTSRVALTIARQRIMAAKFPQYILADSPQGQELELRLGRRHGERKPTGDVRQGFVYKVVPHVTLKAIANNPDVVPGLSRDALADLIARHADTELLYDQPYEDAKTVRVAGPFTVEGLAPHRTAMDVDGDEVGAADATANETNFQDMLLENLRVSGVQTGRKDGRLEFDSVERLAGKYLVANMIPKESGVVRERVAVTIGPRFGTVGTDWIKGAAREALRGEGFDVLLVLGFAFDPLTLEVVDEFHGGDGDGFEVQREARVGALRILLVRMNADLEMGAGLLKKSKNANLFTVFGRPDVRVYDDADGLSVEIAGFDIYNPVTGEVSSGDASDIAMWMVDSEYDSESFFVRQVYFPGREDPYSRLKKALKAEISPEAWETLNSTRSRVFPRPASGKIAVKVINDYGDEVMSVLDVPAP